MHYHEINKRIQFTFMYTSRMGLFQTINDKINDYCIHKHKKPLSDYIIAVICALKGENVLKFC